jgi:hypothetical protein
MEKGVNPIPDRSILAGQVDTLAAAMAAIRNFPFFSI